jgi:hypothetical protein
MQEIAETTAIDDVLNPRVLRRDGPAIALSII